ncbi:MAG: peptide deformylase, partial [Spirochaetota bacterium]|nr:peptide deformylase [Spirochaetota bacterium]
AEGLFARAIQHELDHLNGVLFIDRLDKDEHDRAVQAFNRRNRKRRTRA